MKITKTRLKEIIKEEIEAKLLNEQVANVGEIILQGRAFFDRIIQFSKVADEDPTANAALEQIRDALSGDIEKESHGYVKLVIS